MLDLLRLPNCLLRVLVRYRIAGNYPVRDRRPAAYPPSPWASPGAAAAGSCRLHRPGVRDGCVCSV